jgi:hypothetical protein
MILITANEIIWLQGDERRKEKIAINVSVCARGSAFPMIDQDFPKPE